jgi:hypothetical protein
MGVGGHERHALRPPEAVQADPSLEPHGSRPVLAVVMSSPVTRSDPRRFLPSDLKNPAIPGA